MEKNDLYRRFDSEPFRTVGRCADTLDLQVCVVGGFVRDFFLERRSKDADFVACAVSGTEPSSDNPGIQLAHAVAKSMGRGARVAVFATYGTAQISGRVCPLEMEFVGARKESYTPESRNPVVSRATLAEDLERRDFTINAMAVSLNKHTYGEFIDPFSGLEDLKDGIIRTPLDPDITFSDDPLRMMRAVRFASQLNFRIHPATMQAICRNAGRIKIITAERIAEELRKIMRSPRPSVGLSLLEKSGLMAYIFPELEQLKGVETMEGRGHKDNFAHTLQVVDNVAAVSDNEWLRWAALMHDIGKPVTKRYEPGTGWTFRNHNYIGAKMIPRIFRRLRLPLDAKMKYVVKLVNLHMRPQAVGDEDVTDRGIRRLSKESGEDLQDLMLLAEADITSKNPVKVRRILANFAYVRDRLKEVASKDDWREWHNPLNGHMIKALFSLGDSFEEGRLVGLLQARIKNEIYCIPEKDNFDYALEYLLSIAPEFSLKTPDHPDKQELLGLVKHPTKTADGKIHYPVGESVTQGDTAEREEGGKDIRSI